MNRKTVGFLIGCLSAGLLIGLVVGFFVLFAATKLLRPSDSGQRGSLPSQGMQFADFELYDLNGVPVQLSQFRGHPTVVNFWASWCDPCRAEMPLLQSIHETYRDDLVLIGVNEGETLNMAKAFVDDNHLTFLFLADENGDVGEQFHVRALPTTFFLDADGVLQAQQIGQLDEQQLKGYLKKIGVSP